MENKKTNKPTKENVLKLPIIPELVEEYGQYMVDCVIGDFVREYPLFDKHGDFYYNRRHRSSNHEYELAVKAFFDIQNKKLFNTECLWRAGEIKLSINSSYEFKYHRALVHICPFIEPVTQSEINAYKEYLFEKEYMPLIYNDYETFDKMAEAARDNTGNYNEWYAFYDKKFDTGNLVYLHDKAKKIEEGYLFKHFENVREKVTDKQRESYSDMMGMWDAFHNGELENILFATEERFLQLAELVNDKQFAHKLNDSIDYAEGVAESEEDTEYNYLEYLMHEVPPVKRYYSNWREGIRITAWEHMKLKLIKQIDRLFEDYQKGWRPKEYTEDDISKARKDIKFWEDAIANGKRKMEGQ